MWLLHVVVVQGGGDWHRALTLWLLVAAVGSGYAYLAAEWQSPDALLVDLALAGAGGVLLDLVSRPLSTDPLAGIYDVRVFWTAAGALLALCLAHDAAPLLKQSGHGASGFHLPISGRGGLIFLGAWLSGWPSERGMLEATYGERALELKLLPGSLHYQRRKGPFVSARAIRVEMLRGAEADGDTLVIRLDPTTPAIGSAVDTAEFAAIELDNAEPGRQRESGYARHRQKGVAMAAAAPVQRDDAGVRTVRFVQVLPSGRAAELAAVLRRMADA